LKTKHTLPGLLLGLAAFAAALTLAPAALASTSYTDPAGDSGTAPDITAVTVGSYEGVVTLAVTATGVEHRKWLDVYVNADRNAATGSQDEGQVGADYMLVVHSTWHGLVPVHFLAYTDHWAQMTGTPTMSFSTADDTYTFTFAAADFGNTTGFDLWAESGGHHANDRAPDSGSWSYTITPEPWTVPGALAGLTTDGSIYALGTDGLWHYLSSEAFKCGGYDFNAVMWFGALPGSIGGSAPYACLTSAVAPNVAAPLQAAVIVPAIGTGFSTPTTLEAGKPVVLSFPVTDASSGASLTTVTAMIGNPRLGGTVIRHVEHFGNGYATIAVKLPKTAKGKSLSVALTIRVGDQSTSRTRTFKIH
jgi:hypothetical protein